MSKKRTNVNHKLLASQVQVTKSDFVSHAFSVLSSAPRSVIRLTNLLINISKKMDSIFYSQETLAKMLGVDIKTINRAVKLLDEHGIIIKTNRGLKQSCLYTVPKWLLSKESVLALKDVLTSLKSFLYSTLLNLLSPIERAMSAFTQCASTFAKNKAKQHKSRMKDNDFNGYHSNLKDDISYRCQVALNYCRDMNIKPDWKLLTQIQYHISI